MSMSTPSPTPTITPTASSKPCIKPPRVSFVKGNSSVVAGRDCCCPESVDIRCEYLTINKEYTLNLSNLGPAEGRVFPRKVSFIAQNRTEEFTFFSQFLCSDNKDIPLANTRYIININKPTNVSTSSLNVSVLNCKIGNAAIKDSFYNIHKDDNSISISFDNNIFPTNNSPITFALSISHSSIVNVIKQISIGSLGSVTDTISLISINDPIDSIRIIKQTLSQSTSGGLASASTITCLPTTNKSEQAVVSFAQGTKFYDKNGSTLRGDLTVIVSHFNPIDSLSLDSFAGSSYVNNCISTNSQTIKDSFYLYSTGLLSVEVYDANNVAAHSSSENLSINIEINPLIGNVNNNFNTIAPNDTVPLWILDNAGIYQQNPLCVIGSNNNKLYTTFNTKKLSKYNLAWTLGTCSYISFDARSYIGQNADSRYVFIDGFSDTSALHDSVRSVYRINPVSIRDNKISLVHYPNHPIRIKVYSDMTRTELLGETQILSCGDKPSQPVTPVPITPTPTPTLI